MEHCEIWNCVHFEIFQVGLLSWITVVISIIFVTYYHGFVWFHGIQCGKLKIISIWNTARLNLLFFFLIWLAIDLETAQWPITLVIANDKPHDSKCGIDLADYLKPGYLLTSGVMAWISNCINVKHWDEISFPRPNFNGGLVKTSSKSGHGWIITSHKKLWM